MAGYEHRHCVHGEWMTLKEVCEALGIAKNTLHNWRTRHKRPDGRQALVEEAWDWYKGRASGAIPETRGKKPVRYRYKGRMLSVPEVAERTGIEIHRIYNMMNNHRCGPEAAVERIDELDRRREVNRATRKIMDILNEP